MRKNIIGTILKKDDWMFEKGLLYNQRSSQKRQIQDKFYLHLNRLGAPLVRNESKMKANGEKMLFCSRTASCFTSRSLLYPHLNDYRTS